MKKLSLLLAISMVMSVATIHVAANEPFVPKTYLEESFDWKAPNDVPEVGKNHPNFLMKQLPYSVISGIGMGTTKGWTYSFTHGSATWQPVAPDSPNSTRNTHIQINDNDDGATPNVLFLNAANGGGYEFFKDFPATAPSGDDINNKVEITFSFRNPSTSSLGGILFSEGSGSTAKNVAHLRFLRTEPRGNAAFDRYGTPIPAYDVGMLFASYQNQPRKMGSRDGGDNDWVLPGEYPTLGLISQWNYGSTAAPQDLRYVDVKLVLDFKSKEYSAYFRDQGSGAEYIKRFDKMPFSNKEANTVNHVKFFSEAGGGYTNLEYKDLKIYKSEEIADDQLEPVITTYYKEDFSTWASADTGDLMHNWEYQGFNTPAIVQVGTQKMLWNNHPTGPTGFGYAFKISKNFDDDSITNTGGNANGAGADDKVSVSMRLRFENEIIRPYLRILGNGNKEVAKLLFTRTGGTGFAAPAPTDRYGKPFTGSGYSNSSYLTINDNHPYLTGLSTAIPGHSYDNMAQADGYADRYYKFVFDFKTKTVDVYSRAVDATIYPDAPLVAGFPFSNEDVNCIEAFELSIHNEAVAGFDASRGDMRIGDIHVYSEKWPISVAVTPANAQVEKGRSQQFAANVTVENEDIEKGITWSVVGARSSGTTINAAGNLNVAPDETAETILVRATSVKALSVCGSTIVKVLEQTPDPDPEITVTSAEVMWGDLTVTADLSYFTSITTGSLLAVVYVPTAGRPKVAAVKNMTLVANDFIRGNITIGEAGDKWIVSEDLPATAYVKLFLWDSTAKMEPTCNPSNTMVIDIVE